MESPVARESKQSCRKNLSRVQQGFCFINGISRQWYTESACYAINLAWQGNSSGVVKIKL